jgi:DNA-binding beta-propeller fold protein YncE
MRAETIVRVPGSAVEPRGKRGRGAGLALPALLVGLLAGCLDSKGIDPPTDRFFFPTGLALTAGGRYLLVGNSNFDLKYNSGTINIVDLERVDAAIAECAGRCRQPRDEAAFLAADSTAVIGSQLTDLALSPDGRRAYAAVRGNASLTWIDVDEGAGSGARVLTCADGGAPGAQRCDGRHEIVRTGDVWVPAEPYVLLALEQWVLTGHVDSGDVGLFDVAEGRAPTIVRVLDQFPEGVNGFARHPGGEWLYLVSRASSRIYPFTVSMASRHAGEGPAISSAPAFGVGSNNPGADCRSLVFSPDGTRAFVANREPPSVVVFDSTPRPDGAPDATLLATIELGTGPSRLAIQPLPGGGYVVLVVCFNAEQLFVVDPTLLAVVQVMSTGVGPHALVPDPAAARAYLANFGESTVWVLDYDPGSPYYGQSVLSIGTPEIPSSND